MANWYVAIFELFHTAYAKKCVQLYSLLAQLQNSHQGGISKFFSSLGFSARLLGRCSHGRANDMQTEKYEATQKSCKLLPGSRVL